MANESYTQHRRGADITKRLVDIGDSEYAETAAAPAMAASSGHVHEPADNTDAVVTLAAAGADTKNVLGMVAWSYTDDPTGGSLTIEDGSGTTVFKVEITTGGPGYIPFTPPLAGSDNTAMVVTLAAGGASIGGIVSVHAWTE